MPLLRSSLLGSLLFAAPWLAAAQNPMQVASPDGQLILTLSAGQGPLSYTVDFHGKRLIDQSELGLDLQGQPPSAPTCATVGSSRAAPTKPTPSPSAKQKKFTTTTTPSSPISSELRAASCPWKCGPSTTAWPSATSSPSNPPSAHVHITAERTQFRYSKDATLYPLVLSGFQTSYEDDYQMRTVGGLHRDWLLALPLLARGTRCRLGGHHRGQISTTTPACTCAAISRSSA